MLSSKKIQLVSELGSLPKYGPLPPFTHIKIMYFEVLGQIKGYRRTP